MHPILIAAVCHEANRALTDIVKDVPTQPPWEECGADMQASAVKGVEFALANPNATAEDQHDAWAKERILAGWTHGPVKDVEKKTHPALVPYQLLPEGTRKKDALFRAIVHALK